MIVLRYARNLIAGHGWVYNVGESVNGSTSTLNTLVIACAGIALGGDMHGARLLSFALVHGGLVSLVYLLFRRHGCVPAMFASLLALCTPGVYRTIGLESALLLLCVLGTAAVYSYGRTRLAAALFGAAFLARNDAALLALPVAIHLLWTRRADLRSALTELCVMGAIALAVVAPWLVFSWVSFGSVFPETLAAKLAQRQYFGSGPIFVESAIRRFDSLDDRGLHARAGVLLALFAVTGTCAVMRAKHHVAIALAMSWALLQFTAYSVINLPPYHWYYTPLFFAFVMAVAVTFEAMWNARPAVRLPANLIGCAVAAYVIATCFPDLFLPPPSQQHYHAAGAWFRDATPPDCSIAASDIGIVGYVAEDRRIIDMQGLVTSGGAGPIAAGDTGWWFDRFDPDYVLFHAGPREFHERPVFERAEFHSRYRRVPFLDLGGLQVYRRVAPARHE